MVKKLVDFCYVFLVDIVGMFVIGFDEVGIGDYFGLMIVVCVYVDKMMFFLMKEFGVKDFKDLKDL